MIGRPFYRAFTRLNVLALIETPPDADTEDGSNSSHSGDAGNRTRVRGRVDVASTSVAGALFSSSGCRAGGVPEDQLPVVSPARRERALPGEPAI